MMRESEIKAVFDKIEPSSALLEKTKASVRSAAGEEQSFRFNIRWFIPKIAVATFAVFAIFATVFVVNRAPAIYENSLIFSNKSQFRQIDDSQLPGVISYSSRAVEKAEDLVLDKDGNIEQMQALITCEILEKEMYVHSDSWCVCIYTVELKDVLDVAYTPDFLSGNDTVSVVAYVENENELAALPGVGEEVTMLLRKSEDGNPISEQGEKAGISGAWELWGVSPVENSK